MTLRWIMALALIAVPAGAQAMDVNSFLAKANALKKKGIFAVGSPDIDLLKAEIASVTRDYQADKAVAQRAGKPFVCAPEGAKMSSSEFMAAMEAIPPAQRGMSVKSAFYRIAQTRWPCPRK